MNASLEQLKSTLAALPTAERAELADFLWETLGPSDDIRAEWLAVAEQRMAEIESGQVQGIPAEEVLRTLLDPDK